MLSLLITQLLVLTLNVLALTLNVLVLTTKVFAEFFIIVPPDEAVTSILALSYTVEER
jgi:hypothetical protein